MIRSSEITEEKITAHMKLYGSKSADEAKNEILRFGNKPIQMDEIAPCPEYSTIESIGSSKYASYIISAPDIFKDHNNRDLFRLLEFLNGFSSQFRHAQFPHALKLIPFKRLTG